MSLAAKLLERLQLHAEKFDEGKWHFVVQSGFRGRAGYDGRFIIQDSPERIIALAAQLEPLVAHGELVRFKYLSDFNKPGHPHGINPCLIIFATLEERETILLTLQVYGHEPLKWLHENVSGIEFEKKTRQQLNRAEEDTFRGIVQRASERMQQALQDEFHTKRVVMRHRVFRSEPVVSAAIAVDIILEGRTYRDAAQFLIKGHVAPKTDEIIGVPTMELLAVDAAVHERVVSAVLAARTIVEPAVKLRIRSGLLPGKKG